MPVLASLFFDILSMAIILTALFMSIIHNKCIVRKKNVLIRVHHKLAIKFEY